MPLFTGLGVALVTLFDDDGGVDASATAELAARLVDAGVRGVLAAGTTGEASALEPEERVAVVTAVRAALPASVPVLAGAGAATARQAVPLARAALDAGADAVLALSPPRVSDPRPYYDSLAAAVGPERLYAYSFPAASAPGIPVGVLGELPVSGLKDSSGDATRLLAALDVLPGDLWVGSAALALLAGALGAAGAILAAANAEPELCAAALAGDASAQRALLAAHEVVIAEGPAGAKRLAAARYGTNPTSRS